MLLDPTGQRLGLGEQLFRTDEVSSLRQGSAEPEWIAQEIGFAIPRALKTNPAVNE